MLCHRTYLVLKYYVECQILTTVVKKSYSTKLNHGLKIVESFKLIAHRKNLLKK